jgi:hypothetical protein
MEKQSYLHILLLLCRLWHLMSMRMHFPCRCAGKNLVIDNIYENIIFILCLCCDKHWPLFILPQCLNAYKSCLYFPSTFYKHVWKFRSRECLCDILRALIWWKRTKHLDPLSFPGLNCPCNKSKTEVDMLIDAVHASSSVGYMTSFSSILWFPKYRSAMKILLSTYSGVSHISCMVNSHSFVWKCTTVYL